PLSASETIQVTVNPAAPPAPSPTSIQLSASTSSPVAGQSITFTAVVTSPAGVPGGQVTFMDGGQALGTVGLAGGTARLTTTALRPGRHTIQAVYAGAPDFQAATAPSLTESVLRFAHQPDRRHRGKVILQVGTTGHDVVRVTAVKGGRTLRVEVTERGGHYHARTTISVRTVSQILVFGTARQERLRLGPGVKIP